MKEHTREDKRKSIAKLEASQKSWVETSSAAVVRPNRSVEPRTSTGTSGGVVESVQRPVVYKVVYDYDYHRNMNIQNPKDAERLINSQAKAPPDGTWRCCYQPAGQPPSVCDVEMTFDAETSVMQGRGEDADGMYRIYGYYSALHKKFAWSEKHAQKDGDSTHHMECSGLGVLKSKGRFVVVSGSFLTSRGVQGKMTLCCIRAPGFFSGAGVTEVEAGIVNSQQDVHDQKVSQAAARAGTPALLHVRGAGASSREAPFVYVPRDLGMQPLAFYTLLKYPPPPVPRARLAGPAAQQIPELRRHAVPSAEPSENKPYFEGLKKKVNKLKMSKKQREQERLIKIAKRTDFSLEGGVTFEEHLQRIRTLQETVEELNRGLLPGWECFLDPSCHIPYYINHHQHLGDVQDLRSTWQCIEQSTWSRPADPNANLDLAQFAEAPFPFPSRPPSSLGDVDETGSMRERSSDLFSRMHVLDNPMYGLEDMEEIMLPEVDESSEFFVQAPETPTHQQLGYGEEALSPSSGSSGSSGQRLSPTFGRPLQMAWT